MLALSDLYRSSFCAGWAQHVCFKSDSSLLIRSLLSLHWPCINEYVPQRTSLVIEEYGKRWPSPEDYLRLGALGIGHDCLLQPGSEHSESLLQFLEEELGPEAITTMGKIKKALDPDNIMNPGKIIPPQFCQ